MLRCCRLTRFPARAWGLVTTDLAEGLDRRCCHLAGCSARESSADGWVEEGNAMVPSCLLTSAPATAAGARAATRPGTAAGTRCKAPPPLLSLARR